MKYRTISFIKLSLLIYCVGFTPTACTSSESKSKLDSSLVPTVSQSLSKARTPDGKYISWKEHLVDSQDINGGVPIRGGDGLVMADIDKDGFEDIISVHEDSNHLRIAYGSENPDHWERVTLAEGLSVGAIEDVAVGDLNGDGWLDIVGACEEAHLIYLENPGHQIRTQIWPRLIPKLTQGRGSWLRVFIGDIDGDGRMDITAANKGAADLVRTEAGDSANGPTSLFTLHGSPLSDDSWQEQVLLRDGVPNTAMQVDINMDGRLDILAAARVRQKMFLLVNNGTEESGSVSLSLHTIVMTHPEKSSHEWKGFANAFNSDFADINKDGRLDLVLNVVERETPAKNKIKAGLAWLEQPVSLDDAWIFHPIGTTLPDWGIGLKAVDVDGDGDLDAVTGGYSGINVIAGAYSGAARDSDDPSVTRASSVARLAWFENTGTPNEAWTRHDISRRVRGMYDMFVPKDMDGDGDIDIVATRGNSGEHDGVFWLEQIRTDTPEPAFIPARPSESQQLPLAPDNWEALYDNAISYIAPNKLDKKRTDTAID